jgi:histidine triad (HIT) family protein
VSGCVFCAIAAGTTSAHIVLDEPEVLAFLDHRPLLPGHVLVIPRTHYPTLGDLPPAEVGPFFLTVQRLAGAVERALRADGSFVAANIRISQSVPHLHVHVVPRRAGDGLFGKTFQWLRRPYPGEAAMTEIQHAIQTEVRLPQARATVPPGRRSPPDPSGA